MKKFYFRYVGRTLTDREISEFGGLKFDRNNTRPTIIAAAYSQDYYLLYQGTIRYYIQSKIVRSYLDKIPIVGVLRRAVYFPETNFILRRGEKVEVTLIPDLGRYRFYPLPYNHISNVPVVGFTGSYKIKSKHGEVKLFNGEIFDTFIRI